jgi:hypothetical protein
MMRPATTVVVALSIWVIPCTAGDGSKVASLHADVIGPASEALFQAESAPPATPAQWQKIAARATDLTRAAKALESLGSAKDRKDWLRYARSLAAAAEQAKQAAQAKNQDALVSANGEIVSVCEDCHTTYRDAGRSMKE